MLNLGLSLAIQRLLRQVHQDPGVDLVAGPAVVAVEGERLPPHMLHQPVLLHHHHHYGLLLPGVVLHHLLHSVPHCRWNSKGKSRNFIILHSVCTSTILAASAMVEIGAIMARSLSLDLKICISSGHLFIYLF